MQSHRIPWLAAVALACLLAFGCGRPRLPRAYLDGAKASIRSGHGAWVEMRVRTDGEIVGYRQGELLSISRSEIHLLVPTGENFTSARIESHPFARVREIDVYAYDPMTGGYVLWTALGAASTISHGYFLIFTLPVWLLSGTLATAQEAGSGTFDEMDPVSQLNEWSRFPQGLPPGLEEGDLHIYIPRPELLRDARVGTPVRFQDY